MPRLLHLVMGLAFLGLTGCAAVGPDYRPPAGSVYASAEAGNGFVGAKAGLTRQEGPPEAWWRLFDDPVLDDLVTSALTANTDLRAAAANLARAHAIASEAEHLSEPDLSFVAGAQRARMSGESFLLPQALPAANLGDVGLEASYQADLFGRVRRIVEAARADEQAVEAARDTVRITVAAEVARAYVAVCAANANEALARRSLEIETRRLEIQTRLAAAGRQSAADLPKARARADQAQAATHIFIAQRREALYTLAALTGKLPADYPRRAEDCARIPRAAAPLPVGDGAGLLRRRPDIRQAERELAAASARIGVATADLYPSVRFGLGAGSTGFLADLGRSAANRWDVGSLVTWSFPGGGERARIRAANAASDAALARFDGAVLRALRETETGLSRFAEDARAEQDLKLAQSEAAAAADQVRRLRLAGKSPYLAGLDAAQIEASAEAAATQSEARLASDQISLFLALGGGWR